MRRTHGSATPYALSDRDRSLEGYTLGWLANGQHDYAAVQLAQEALAMSDHQPLSFPVATGGRDQRADQL